MSLIQVNLTDYIPETNQTSELVQALNMTATIPKNTFFSIGFGADDLYDLDVIMFRALQSIDTIEVKDMTFAINKST